jgi:hypothetical protein
MEATFRDNDFTGVGQTAINFAQSAANYRSSEDRTKHIVLWGRISSRILGSE